MHILKSPYQKNIKNKKPAHCLTDDIIYNFIVQLVGTHEDLFNSENSCRPSET